MITIERPINMYPLGVPLIIRLSQYDDDFTLVFDLYSSDGNFEIQSGTTASIRGTKTDSNGYSADCTIDIATAKVTVAGNVQMTACAGRNVYELVLAKDGKVLSTANFVLLVERAAMDADTVPSESVIREIGEAVNEYLDEHDFVTDPTLSISGRAADAKKTGDEIADLKSDLNNAPGLTAATRQTLLDAFQHLVWKDNDTSFYVALRDALLGGGRLPSEYQEVEYIEATGTQYIDTEILSALPMKAEVKALATQSATPFVGAGVSSNGNSRFFFFGWMQSRVCSRFSSDGNGNIPGADSWLTEGTDIPVNQVFEATSEISSSGVTTISVVGGSSISRQRAIPTLGYPIKVMIQPNTGTCVPGRIYSLKIYTGDTLLFNGVPCYVKESGAGGLYDLVSESFFGNRGTGSFVIGPNVL